MAVFSQSWPEPSPDARPGTRWWWMGSAVDSVNIRNLMEEYSLTGIGAVEITPIYGVRGNDANEIKFLTPEWMRMLRTVEATGASNGMIADMNQGTGWPFGGPEVTVEDAAAKIFFLVDTVASGAASAKSVPGREEKIARLIKESRRPLHDGREEVIRAYESRTLQQVKRAAPGGEGLVLDHLNRDAVARYLDKFDKAFSSTSTPWPHAFFNDSYEVYNANWTPSLPEEFKSRRGYDILDSLPQLLGLVDDGNKVLSDFRRTISELLLENFTEQWAAWAHQRGVKVRNQAHGSPANLIDVYAAVDIPEIEGFGLSDFGIKGLRTDKGFTRKNDSDVSMLKYASSAAHITGKPLTSSETFTWLTEHFRTSLSQMKPDLDLMFSCGVNNVYFHGTTYSPLDEPWPGWKFYASVDMSPTNTIWRDAPALMEYITRCQSMLREGRPDNDFLVYLPVDDMWKKRLKPGTPGLMMEFSIHHIKDLAPEFIESIMEIDSLGYDTDYISDRYLLSTVYDGKNLVTAAGTPYKALIIPGSGNLSEPLRAHLDSLVAQGADIIYGIDHARIKRAAKDEQLRTKLGLRALRRATDDGFLYFIANLSPNDVDSAVPLAVGYADAVWFDPMTGDIYQAQTNDENIRVNLASGESRFLRVYNHKLEGIAKAPSEKVVKEINLTDRPWNLTFTESYPEVKEKIKLDSLKWWTDLNDSKLNELSGTGVYTTTVNIPKKEAAGEWQIDLGDVRESARVYINGKYAGTAWAAPFRLNFRDLLKPGKNEIRIEVTNLPANRISAMDRRGEDWRKFKEINIVDINYKKTNYANWSTLPSGLSSVILRRLE